MRVSNGDDACIVIKYVLKSYPKSCELIMYPSLVTCCLRTSNLPIRWDLAVCRMISPTCKSQEGAL
jgi:hypothetical protein